MPTTSRKGNSGFNNWPRRQTRGLYLEGQRRERFYAAVARHCSSFAFCWGVALRTTGLSAARYSLISRDLLIAAQRKLP